jgi:hypothetical protein
MQISVCTFPDSHRAAVGDRFAASPLSKFRQLCCMILDVRDAGQAGAVGAAIESIVCLDAVANDLTSAVITHGRQFVNRAFKAIKRMPCPSRDDLKGKIVIVSAYLTCCHLTSPYLAIL